MNEGLRKAAQGQGFRGVREALTEKYTLSSRRIPFRIICPSQKLPAWSKYRGGSASVHIRGRPLIFACFAGLTAPETLCGGKCVNESSFQGPTILPPLAEWRTLDTAYQGIATNNSVAEHTLRLVSIFVMEGSHGNTHRTSLGEVSELHLIEWSPSVTPLSLVVGHIFSRATPRSSCQQTRRNTLRINSSALPGPIRLYPPGSCGGWRIPSASGETLYLFLIECVRGNAVPTCYPLPSWADQDALQKCRYISTKT